MPTNLARMMSMATEVLNTTWPSRIVPFPRGGKAWMLLRACTKKMREATAMTISGTTRVRYTRASNGARSRGFIRARARAAHRPRTVAMIDAAAAIWRLVTIAGMKVGSCSPALNQHDVKPFQTVMFPTWSGGMLQILEPWWAARAAGDGLLKAKTAITRIGRNKNAYTTTAQPVNACLALSRPLRPQLPPLSCQHDVPDHQPPPPPHPPHPK